MNYNPRPYHPGPHQTVSRPPPQPMFQQGADLVRLIESQIVKISLTETFAVARCLGGEHGLVGNPYISGVMISRKNQEFSRGDSWFNVQWFELLENHHTPIPRSVNLRFEPGRQVCTSYSADEVVHQHHEPRHQHIAPRQDIPPSVGPTPMDLDPPKQMVNWSGLVGELFDKAAGIVDDQIRDKTPEQTSTALWPTTAWHMIKTIIWGHQMSKSVVYTIGIPYVFIRVLLRLDMVLLAL
jgi:hypothetical protein